MKLLICDSITPATVKAMKKAGIKVDIQDDITPENLEADLDNSAAWRICSGCLNLFTRTVGQSRTNPCRYTAPAAS